jgi:DNA-binding NtrC family response regulator/predicted hydrocarbon binding protein
MRVTEVVMKAEDLKLDELVTFSEGLLSLHGRRLILHDIHAMAQFRRDLLETLGPEQARRILTRFGYYWGQVDAAAMKRIFQWESLTELLMAGPRLHSLQGAARAEIRSFHLAGGERLEVEVVWHAGAEAEEHTLELGVSEEPACWIHTGYASGYASFCLGEPVYFVETSCRARGDALCVAVGKDRGSWGEEAESIAAFFEAEDIREKILGLTEELRARTREVARQKQRLLQLEGAAELGLAEIRSRAFRRVVDLALRVARFDSSVLLTGESGVGKEVVARLIHEHSHRSGRGFVAVNCGALPETLLEAELFGYRKGSFTGAVRDRAGLFEEADGGTLLLDEVGDIPPSVQVKLLRVLQEKKIRRLGENAERPVDVRVIAATNRQLKDEPRQDRFREDLFYRLSVVEIEIPPLRDRPEDIVPLVRLFTERLAERLKLPGLSLDATCLDLLQSYEWPGNVRELENSLERAAVMSEEGRVLPEHFPPSLRGARAHPMGAPRGRPRTLAELERHHILTVLEKAGGNRTRAAKILGISATTLWRKLKAWGEEG